MFFYANSREQTIDFLVEGSGEKKTDESRNNKFISHNSLAEIYLKYDIFAVVLAILGEPNLRDADTIHLIKYFFF